MRHIKVILIAAGLLYGSNSVCHAQATQALSCSANFHVLTFDKTSQNAAVAGNVVSTDGSITINVIVAVNAAGEIKLSDTIRTAKRLSKTFLLDLRKESLSHSYKRPNDTLFVISAQGNPPISVTLQNILMNYNLTGDPTNDQAVDRVLNHAADLLHQIAPCIRDE